MDSIQRRATYKVRRSNRVGRFECGGVRSRPTMIRTRGRRRSLTSSVGFVPEMTTLCDCCGYFAFRCSSSLSVAIGRRCNSPADRLMNIDGYHRHIQRPITPARMTCDDVEGWTSQSDSDRSAQQFSQPPSSMRFIPSAIHRDVALSWQSRFGSTAVRRLMVRTPANNPTGRSHISPLMHSALNDVVVVDDSAFPFSVSSSPSFGRPNSMVDDHRFSAVSQ